MTRAAVVRGLRLAAGGADDVDGGGRRHGPAPPTGSAGPAPPTATASRAIPSDRRGPARVRSLVISPPVPGAGQRLLGPDVHREFWYQHLHRLDLAERLLDGDLRAVRTYLEHFWTHWYRQGPGILTRGLAERAPAPEDRLAVRTHVLWPAHDPLFPPGWGDRLDEFFADVTVTPLPDSGHFVPLEAPDAFGSAIQGALAG